MSLFHGSNINVNFAHVELKYFFYVCVGIVAWALLDLLIVLHVVIDQHVTAPLVFLAVSQFMVIFHTLLYEVGLVHNIVSHIIQLYSLTTTATHPQPQLSFTQPQ